MNESELRRSRVIFRERVLPGASLFATLLIIGPSIAVALWPVSTIVALVTGSIATLVALGIAVVTSPVIEVCLIEGQGFIGVGRAKIAARYIASATLIPEEKRSFAKGPGLDARAFRMFQIGAKDLVQLKLNDPADPTPYWLVSSRRGKDFLAAIDQL